MSIKKSVPERVGNAVVVVLCTLFAVVTLYPFWYVMMYSISDPALAMRGGLFIIPKGFSTYGYTIMFKSTLVFRNYGNTILVTVVGTAINLALTATLAYPLSIKRLYGRRFLSLFIFFTMLFSGGMIPHFLVVKSLGLLDSLWALILPGAVRAYNMFIMRNFFQGIPPSLEESASIDGATPARTLVSVIIPIAVPVFAALGMFYGIAHWNAYFDCLLYINDNTKQTLQVFLRTLIEANTITGDVSIAQAKMDAASKSGEIIKMAAICFSIIPVLVVYPWLQKYYIKGVIVGSVKG